MSEFFAALVSNPAITNALWPAFLETVVMVGISGLATVLVGLPLGVVLFITQPGGLAESRVVNAVLGAVIVNITRSIPYAILMLTLIPVTRILVGTSIGPIGASVSLSIAAIPFFARLVETGLREVHPGKLDAAHAMGSTRLQTVWKVLLPESLPSLVASITTTVVTLIGYSAMAGLIGGGGLGRLAYNYGYQRYQGEVMVVILIVLVLLVQLVQWTGDRLVRRVDHR
ncbi:MAG: methionine ABC transporter permease [Propionicimonas sp.]|uniref:methionine ABC transporter permease n=1 Tax=Propionicimonas sp. TaxID=1955623 RepID=UPI002B20C7F9|nr:methionine ABC transporter permease [Propionicimonas sp.]MEA4944560.1 methionine ABC transporter permease [Propionicimonas sp.]MEA5052353.1 methionine ABC transporter permease [Propionicimonas sp.]